MGGTYAVSMGDRGRLVVPAALRQDLGWSEGTQLHFVELEGGGAVVLTRAQLAAFVRADWQARGRGALEDLLAERRAEAAADHAS